MAEVKISKLALATRLKKAAASLYAFLENPESVRHPDALLLATAHLMDVTSTDVEVEMIGLKRTIGGLSAKVSHQAKRISELEAELAVEKARNDRARNSESPAARMAVGYDCR